MFSAFVLSAAMMSSAYCGGGGGCCIRMAPISVVPSAPQLPNSPILDGAAKVTTVAFCLTLPPHMRQLVRPLWATSNDR